MTAPAARPAGLTYAERLELERLESEVEAAESRVGELEAVLGDPATWAEGPDRGRELGETLATARAELEALMSRWELLEAKRQ